MNFRWKISLENCISFVDSHGNQKFKVYLKVLLCNILKVTLSSGTETFRSTSTTLGHLCHETLTANTAWREPLLQATKKVHYKVHAIITRCEILTTEGTVHLFVLSTIHQVTHLSINTDAFSVLSTEISTKVVTVNKFHDWNLVRNIAN